MPTGVNIPIEEKISIAKEAIAARNGGERVVVTAEKMGIHHQQIHKYVREYKAGEYDILPTDLIDTVTEGFNGEPEQISVTVYDKEDNKKSIEIVVDKPETDSITEYKKELHASVKARLGIILEGEDFE